MGLMPRAVEFVAVLRDGVVVAAYGDGKVATEINLQQRLPPITAPGSHQLVIGNRTVSFVVVPPLLFVAVTPLSTGPPPALHFITDLSRAWIASYGIQSRSAGPHSMDGILATDFGPRIESMGRPPSSVGLVHQELDETQQVIGQSLIRALDRGASLESVASKSEELLDASATFRERATDLRRAMCWSRAKAWVFRGAVATLLIYLVVALFCGLALQKCRSS